MYCNKCGKEIPENNTVCPNCMSDIQTVDHPKKQQTGLTTAAKVFMILGTVIGGFSLIPLAWCIPMTIHYFKKVNDGESVSTGFKVCSLLFVSLLGGVFMLCDKD